MTSLFVFLVMFCISHFVPNIGFLNEKHEIGVEQHIEFVESMDVVNHGLDKW
jgi:hypothetical protein